MHYSLYHIYIAAFIINILIFKGERADWVQKSREVTLLLRILVITVFIFVRYALKSLKRSVIYTFMGLAAYSHFRIATGDSHLTLILTLIIIGIIRFWEGLGKEIINRSNSTQRRLFNLGFLVIFIMTTMIFLLYNAGIKLMYPIEGGIVLVFVVSIGTFFYCFKGKRLMGHMVLTSVTFLLALVVMLSNESSTKQYIFNSPNGSDRLIVEESRTFMGDRLICFYRDKFFIFKEPIPYEKRYNNLIYGYGIESREDIEVNWLDKHKVSVEIGGKVCGADLDLRGKLKKFNVDKY
ncbi:MAG: hypothetical protein RR844_03015 [Clostridium sp.]